MQEVRQDEVVRVILWQVGEAELREHVVGEFPISEFSLTGHRNTNPNLGMLKPHLAEFQEHGETKH